MDDLAEEWNEREAIQRFTLDGPLGQLVFPHNDLIARNEQRNCILAVTSPEPEQRLDSLTAWYRLLCLGCSLSIPHGTMPLDRVQTLWAKLIEHRFWELTIPIDLGNINEAAMERELDLLFREIIHSPLGDRSASGEDDQFWRRVFFDFRRMRSLVFNDGFPQALMEVAEHPATTGDQLVDFFKTGTVPIHLQSPPWRGVIGQSMSAPLLFVLRELRLMGVLSGERFNSVCYYMNSPARRIAARLQWIEPEEQRNDFESLLKISEMVHFKMNETETGRELCAFLDIPLQWYAFRQPC